MALDGITIAALAAEFKARLEGAKINKIAQPEADELLITLKNQKEQYRLCLSANASLPLMYLAEENRPSPLTAPNFCMLLRKHIGSGRILSVRQPGLERILIFTIEHTDELGDIRKKLLICETMGKHSNIIFCDEDKKILDAIKHVPSHMSSVREVLPGRTWFIPETQEKADPLAITEEDFVRAVAQKPMAMAKAIYTTMTGISPLMAEEFCARASLDGSAAAASLTENEKLHLAHTFCLGMEDVREGRFSPQIIYDKATPVEYAVFPLQQYRDMENRAFPTVSEMLRVYYAAKDTQTRIRQKSAELRKIVSTAIDRSRKKLDLQVKQMRDTEKRDRYRIYGELLHTYGYGIPPGTKNYEAVNYYTGEPVTIPLDATMTPAENAKKYFDKYNKLKRTAEALTLHIRESQDELSHLESVAASLEIAVQEEDLVQVKEELIASGYIRRHSDRKGKRRAAPASRPFHYRSADGFDIYVGKNNYQNDDLTFRQASGSDWWFHAKNIPGSHVILKSGTGEIPTRAFEEAGRLAAYYSKSRTAPKVEVDYTQKKNVKKPSGGKPGFVVYYTNYSLLIDPDISGIEEIADNR